MHSEKRNAKEERGCPKIPFKILVTFIGKVLKTTSLDGYFRIKLTRFKISKILNNFVHYLYTLHFPYSKFPKYGFLSNFSP